MLCTFVFLSCFSQEPVVCIEPNVTGVVIPCNVISKAEEIPVSNIKLSLFLISCIGSEIQKLLRHLNEVKGNQSANKNAHKLIVTLY